MNNFSINTNFQQNDFDNSISNYNKTFSEQNSDFEKIFKSLNQKPLEANVQFYQGLDSIALNKVDFSQNQEMTKHEQKSPVEKMVSDISSGLGGALNTLNDFQRQAEENIETFASGGDISIHDVMISSQKSALSMQMAIQLRSQVLNAYNELKNISI